MGNKVKINLFVVVIKMLMLIVCWFLSVIKSLLLINELIIYVIESGVSINLVIVVLCLSIFCVYIGIYMLILIRKVLIKKLIKFLINIIGFLNNINGIIGFFVCFLIK